MTKPALSPVSSHSYRALHNDSVIDYLAGLPLARALLGDAPNDWQATEIGDGNLNLVFIVRGEADSIIVKQALPYVRLVGESWPLPLSRAYFEQLALTEYNQHIPHHAPQLHFYDDTMALMIMQHLTPHIILRKELMAKKTFPNLATHLGFYLAQMAFATSDLSVSPAAKRAKMTAYLTNNAMCKITEDLIFDEPYFAAPMNQHNPLLDDLVAEFRSDSALKIAAQQMKYRFLNAPETLCHGDLHTGSIMVTAGDTRLIDPEFAFYGPMGFDVGMVLANIMMAYYAHDGDRDYQDWLHQTVQAICAQFTTHLKTLWKQRCGALYPHTIFNDDATNDAGFDAFITPIFHDAAGFCGAEIIRRILGLAHVDDFESIADLAIRASRERRALLCGRAMLINHRHLTHENFSHMLDKG